MRIQKVTKVPFKMYKKLELHIPKEIILREIPEIEPFVNKWLG